MRHEDALTWYEAERDLRSELSYPPFGRLAKIRIQGKLQNAVIHRAKHLADAIRNEIGHLENDFEVMGPTEAAIEKIKGVFRWDILIKSRDLKKLHHVLGHVRSLAHSEWEEIVLIDVDPSGMS
jgi:primosomal protein N' (replication factor Y)